MEAKAIGNVVWAMSADVSAEMVQEQGGLVLTRACNDESSVSETRRVLACTLGAIEKLVIAMRNHHAARNVLANCCTALGNICYKNTIHKERATEAGAFEAIVAALQVYSTSADVQVRGCIALTSIWSGGDAEARARRQRATDVGAIGVVANAAHMSSPRVVDAACAAMATLFTDCDPVGLARKQCAASAGIIGVVVGALRQHPQSSSTWKRQYCVFVALDNICRGEDDTAEARKQLAADAGAIQLAVNALELDRVVNHKESALMLLLKVCAGSTESERSRKQIAVDVDAIEVVAECMWEHVDDEGIQEQGCRFLDLMCSDLPLQGCGRCDEDWMRSPGVGCMRCAIEVGVEEAAMDAMEQYPRNRTIQILGNGLRGLSSSG